MTPWGKSDILITKSPFLCAIFRNCYFPLPFPLLVNPHFLHVIQTTKQGKITKFCQSLSKVIHLPSAETESRIYWQKSLTTETDAKLWQPFTDHPVGDTFLDSQLHRDSRCSSPSPDDVGRLNPVVFDDDGMCQQRSE